MDPFSIALKIADLTGLPSKLSRMIADKVGRALIQRKIEPRIKIVELRELYGLQRGEPGMPFRIPLEVANDSALSIIILAVHYRLFDDKQNVIEVVSWRDRDPFSSSGFTAVPEARIGSDGKIGKIYMQTFNRSQTVTLEVVIVASCLCGEFEKRMCGRPIPLPGV